MTDARSWTQAEQERVRRTAIRAALGGMTHVAAAELFGVCESTMNSWMLRHREGGDEALLAQ